MVQKDETIETPKTGREKFPLRQKTMTSFADKVDATEARHLIDSIEVFFFACRIPFNIIENFFFKTMIYASRPSRPFQTKASFF